MKLISIKTENVKGQSIASQPLTGRDIFIGPNGSGKSTRLEAVMTGILGYVPRLGKTVGDTFKLASDKKMGVGLTTDTGLSFGRDFEEVRTRHKDGSVSYKFQQKISVSPSNGEKNDTERAARLDKEVGNFSVMFDLDSFMNQTDTEQKSFIFGLVDPSQHGWDRDRVMAEVHKVMGKHTSSVEDSRIRVFNQDLDMFASPTLPVQDVVESLYERAKEIRSGINEIKRKKNAAKEELLLTKQKIGQQSAADLSQLRIRLAAQEKLSAELGAKKSAEHVMRVQMLANRQREAKLVKDLANVSGEVIVDGIPLTVSQASERLSTMQSSLAEATRQVNAIRDGLEKDRNAVHAIALDISRVDRRRELQTLGKSLTDSQGVCPTCGSKPSVDPKIKIDQLKKEFADITVKVIALQKNKEVIDSSIETLSKTLPISTEAMNKFDVSTRALAKSIITAEASTQVKANITSELAAVRATISGLAVTTSEEEINAQVNAVTEEVSKLKTSIKVQEEMNTILTKFDDAKIGAMQAEKEFELLEDICLALGPRGMQGKILRDAIVPLQEKVNSVLASISDSYQLQFTFEDKNEKESFKMGWLRDGKIVPFSSLSGGERILFSSALAIGLVLLKDPPLKVLCIEAAEIDTVNFGKLLESLDILAGSIDNVLIATHYARQEDLETHKNWRVTAL
jgi:exonuclease SbcC